MIIGLIVGLIALLIILVLKDWQARKVERAINKHYDRLINNPYKSRLARHIASASKVDNFGD